MDRYLKILKKYANEISYMAGMDEKFDSELEYITNRVTAPVMVSYVWWVLTEAKNREIHTLYFFARDGYTLCEIAKLFCEKFNLQITCKYLYCSRAALRMPTYHFLGEESYHLLFLGGYYVTPEHMLDRIECSEQERKNIYREINFNYSKKDDILSGSAFDSFCEKLRKSQTYNKIFVEKSKQAYINTLGYFEQEGLLRAAHVAIVDTGWTGSMQRSLRQILEYAGYTPKITGFYFGMYAEAKEEKDGEYLTWYFSQKGPKLNRMLFCNNLLECMLAAPHGMTTGYKQENGAYIPVQKTAPDNKQLADTLVQHKTILLFARKISEKTTFSGFQKVRHLDLTQELLKKLMVFPEQKEVEAYQNFLFCDDITESYQMQLHTGQYDLKRYLILQRVYRKFMNKKAKEQLQQPEALWIFASIAFLPKYKQVWYRLNILLWEWLKCVLKKG